MENRIRHTNEITHWHSSPRSTFCLDVLPSNSNTTTPPTTSLLVSYITRGWPGAEALKETVPVAGRTADQFAGTSSADTGVAAVTWHGGAGGQKGAV